MNFQGQIYRIFRASVIGLALLFVMALFFLTSQSVISHTQSELSALQRHLYRETRLMMGLQEKFSFVMKYRSEREKLKDIWHVVLQDIQPDMQALEETDQARNALVSKLQDKFIVTTFTDFDQNLLRINEGELRLREWAAEGLRILQGADDIIIADLGPLESGLIGRGAWIDHAEHAFENLSKARSQVEQLQRGNFLAFIAAISVLLFTLIRFFLFPAMRGALDARRMEREEMTLRHALQLLPQLLNESFSLRSKDWQSFFDLASAEMSIEENRFSMTFTREDGHLDPGPAHAGQVQSRSDTPHDGTLVTTLNFPEEWEAQKTALRRTVERLHAMMLHARHDRITRALEADRDTYFAFLKASLDSLPIATGLFNVAGELVFCNDPFLDHLKNFGVTLKENTQLGDCVAALTSQETRAAILLKDMFEKCENAQFQCKMKDTDYHWQSVIIPHQGVLFCARDITAEIAQAEAAYNEKRLESLGTLSGGVSHDVNNFLSIILNNVELAREQANEALRNECFDEAIQACLDAGRINKQLVSYARKQPLMPTAVDPNDIITSCRKYALQWHRQDDVTVSLTSQNWFWADEAGLKSAIINLFKNALEATTTGQGIALDICDAVASFGAAVKITLTDSGPGFPGPDPSRYLEPFYSTKATGSGLGLSAVEGFVKQSSGHLTVKNREDRNGAEISVTLPAVPRAERPSGKIVKGSSPDNRRKYILIVDDNHQMLRTMEIALGSPNFLISKATTVTAALEQIDAADAPRFDLLVSDMVLPDGNGFEISRRFKSKFPQGAVLYVSGFPSDHFEESMLEISAQYLAKPFPIDMLKKHVRDLLQATSDHHSA